MLNFNITSGSDHLLALRNYARSNGCANQTVSEPGSTYTDYLNLKQGGRNPDLQRVPYYRQSKRDVYRRKR